MDFQQFLDALDKIKHNYKWEIWAGKQIRGVPRNHSATAKAVYCPITAVCRSVHKGNFETWDWDKASGKLGEIDSDAEIVTAADDTILNSHYCTGVRLRLKEVLRL